MKCRSCNLAACTSVYALCTVMSLKWYWMVLWLILFASADEPFVGASVGYFAFLGVLAGRSFTVILL